MTKEEYKVIDIKILKWVRKQKILRIFKMSGIEF